MTTGHQSPHAYIVASAASSQCWRDAQKYARSNEPIFLRGETGVGKTLLASKIHEQSRPGKPFEPVNLAGLDEPTASAALFGSVKGAYTGSIKDVQGHIELAEDGTVFLDEIADAPMGVQQKLLAVLDCGTYYRVGEPERARTTTARFICATHRDPQAAIRAGKLREDLYYRLDSLVIVLPPLRERREDIAPLAREFFRKQLPEERWATIDAHAKSLAKRFDTHAWPGNARTVKKAVTLAVVEIVAGTDPAQAIELAYAKMREERIEHGSPDTFHEALVSFIARYIHTRSPRSPGLMEVLSAKVTAAIAEAYRRQVVDPTFKMPQTPTELGKQLGNSMLAAGKVNAQPLSKDVVRYPELAALMLLAQDDAVPLPLAVRTALLRTGA